MGQIWFNDTGFVGCDLRPFAKGTEINPEARSERPGPAQGCDLRPFAKGTEIKITHFFSQKTARVAIYAPSRRGLKCEGLLRVEGVLDGCDLRPFAKGTEIGSASTATMTVGALRFTPLREGD